LGKTSPKEGKTSPIERGKITPREGKTSLREEIGRERLPLERGNIPSSYETLPTISQYFHPSPNHTPK